MSQLKPGARLRSVVCTTEVVVIAASDAALTVTCGGVAMIGEKETPPEDVTLDPALAEGTQLGKRYSNESGNLELLCVKPGAGSLVVDEVPLALKGAKPLPSSD